MNNITNAMTAMNINGKKAVFAYGTFEPINDTNTKLITEMVLHAKKTGADPYIIVTHTGSGVNAKKPKLAELFPNVTIMGTSLKEPTLGYIVNRLRTNKNYKTISMVARTNAVETFKTFVNVNNVVNSGVSKRTPGAVTKPKNSKGVTMSTKLDRNMRALERMMKNMF